MAKLLHLSSELLRKTHLLKIQQHEHQVQNQSRQLMTNILEILQNNQCFQVTFKFSHEPFLIRIHMSYNQVPSYCHFHSICNVHIFQSISSTSHLQMNPWCTFVQLLAPCQSGWHSESVSHSHSLFKSMFRLSFPVLLGMMNDTPASSTRRMSSPSGCRTTQPVWWQQTFIINY